MVALRALRPLAQTAFRRATGARRTFFAVSTPEGSSAGGVAVTKYKIVKPGREGTTWDDFLIALPDKDQLAKTTKEVPLFIRYLKLVTSTEGRDDAFQEFFERCKNGLVVESDAYITAEELLAVMWKNGYSDQERNALQYTFPMDYKFHYPELAVFFDLVEEDCYKFCLRTRMEKSHIGELDVEKVRRKGFIRDHWIIFGFGATMFSQFPFFNYYFWNKVFGTVMWNVTMWAGFSRSLGGTLRRNQYMAEQKTAHEIGEGQDKLLDAMMRFSNDSSCVDHLKSFKSNVQSTLTDYRGALAHDREDELASKILGTLGAVKRAESSAGASLQSSMVKEMAESFKSKIGDAGVQKGAFDSAIAGIKGEKAANDPVLSHFSQALSEVANADLMSTKPNKDGSVVERLANVQQQAEKSFCDSFMVTNEEAAAVKQIAGKAGGDWSKLSAEDSAKLEELYKVVNGKTGFSYLHEANYPQIPKTGDADADKYLDAVNQEIAVAQTKIRNARLSSFAGAF